MWRLNTSRDTHNILIVCVLWSPYIYITLYLHRDFACIREHLNAMKNSIELCLL